MRRDLTKIRGNSRKATVEQSPNEKYERSLSPQPDFLNDLRGTIKKEVGEMKEMKIKL